jgi:catechol-2,3-dioxygenase
MSEIRGIAEIVLNVHDMEASLAFYRDLLVLPVLGAPGPVFLEVAPGHAGVPQMLVLVPMVSGSEPFAGPRALHHLALEVTPEGFDALDARLRAYGYVPRTGKHPVIPSRTLYIDDPEGNEVEVICRDG